jgi:hypothetical protein
MTDKLIKSGFHWSFGWMRKKSEDCEHGYAYEHPDGDLIWTPRMDHKLIAYLDCFQDAETGEKYVAFSSEISSVMARKHTKFNRA